MSESPVTVLTELPHPARTARWGPWRATPPGSRPVRRLRLLLLHGFAGAPGELRPLGQALLQRGFSVEAPLLPGHGENLEAMREVLLEDWLEAVALTYQRLRQQDQPVALVGFNLGGALSLRLASQLNPRAVCCLAAPAGPLPEASYPRQDDLRSTLANLDDTRSSEIRRWRYLGYHLAVPESFFAQYQRLLQEVPEHLPEVRCPLLVAQSRFDRVTPPPHAEQIVAEAKRADCRLVWCRKAGHALPVDVGRQALFQEIGRFLETQDRECAKPFVSDLRADTPNRRPPTPPAETEPPPDTL